MQKPVSNSPVPARPSALVTMAKRINVEPDKLLGTLQATCFKGSTPEQLLALVVVSNVYDLNPFLREIYAFPAKGGGIVPVVSVDGWIKMVNRDPNFDGIEFIFEEDNENQGQPPLSATCIIYLKNRSKPVKVTEYFDECRRKTDPWDTMPRRMLRHKALIQAARIAFGFSGIQDEDEAIDVISTVTPDVRNQPRQLPPREFRAPESEVSAATEEVPMQFGEEVPAKEASSIRKDFQAVMAEVLIDFTTLQKWGISSGNIPNADTYGSVDEIPEETLKRLLRAKAGLITQLKAAKGL